MGAPWASSTIARQLTGVFALLVLLVIAVGGAGVASMVLAIGAAEDATRTERVYDANADALQAMTDAETGVRGYRLSQDSRFLQPYWEGTEQFPRAIAAASANTRNEHVRQALARQERAAERWQHLIGRPIAALPPGEAVSSPREVRSGKRAFDAFRAANAAVAKLSEADRARFAVRATRLQTTSVLVMLAGLFVAVAVALVAAVRTTRGLVGPLDSLRRTLVALTEGARDARAGEERGPAEIREVSRAVNSLAEEAERLHGERAEIERLRQVAVEIGRQVRDSLDVEDVLYDAVRAVGVQLACDRAFVELLDPQGAALVAVQWSVPGLWPLPTGHPTAVTNPLTPLAGAATDGPVVVCDDAAADPRMQSVDGLHYLLLTGAKSLGVVPIAAGGQLLGLLSVVRVVEAPRWSQAEVQAIEAIAADLGRALVHARIFEQQSDLVSQLRELDRTKTEFLSTVEHELRTPLTSIAGYIELIKDGDAGPVSDDMRQMLDVVDRNTERLKSLIDDLLTLSRIESGAFRMTHRETRVGDLVRGVAATVHPGAAAAGLTLTAEPGPERVVVSGDGQQLERMLLNLLTNAVKFTPEGGSVAVTADVDGDEVVLVVRDSGIGIPETEQVQLFSRFFRATNATSRAIPGTGLGLAIVRGIAEQHGGAVEMRSREGVGTTVTVRLPVSGRNPGAAGTPRDATAFASVVSSSGTLP